ncbi:MAG TPA: dihydrolipoamide acetyltransferase family protein [Kineosporiaceae bacterium]
MSTETPAGIQVFRLPDAGEGLTEAEIVSWRVAVGDVVADGDPIVEIETAKSLVELPCPYAGTVAQLLAPVGATVRVGEPIIAVATGPGAGALPAPPAGGGQGRADQPPPGVPGAAAPPAERTAVLVGYGPRAATLARRRRVAPTGAPRQNQPPAPDPDQTPRPGSTPSASTSALSPRPVPGPVPEQGRPLAKPPVRKLARDLGVDLRLVPPSGPEGVVTRADVERAARPALAPQAPQAPAGAPATPSRDTRVPVKGVRRATAAAMVASAFTAPHVTEWVQADVSRTVRLTERLRGDRAFEGVRVSPLLLVAKAVLLAAARHPGINASWDEAAGEIVVHHYVNLGIAVSTPRGLVVPNIKDAHTLTLPALARALADLTATAREGRATPADQTGGTFTITNVGVFGVDGGTPILNPPEAGILAVGRFRRMPWVHRGRVRPRWVTTLSLSFDHRLVDGDLGSRFLADVAAVLHDPATALLW